jgi:hypothetical protein
MEKPIKISVRMGNLIELKLIGHMFYTNINTRDRVTFFIVDSFIDVDYDILYHEIFFPN